MKLSEELIYRGFQAETTIENPEDLDSRASKKFYWGADPSADSLTIGNLAALMMCVCFIRHGYEPYLLVGGATGQIGDPKENGERELKSIDTVSRNKSSIKSQIERIVNNAVMISEKGQGKSSQDSSVLTMLDNLSWFKDIKYLDFLREIGKSFSMTQLLDRQFVQNRIGAGGSGISYAEFSYTLIQGYDFLHLFREYGIDLQLCGADQYGNCSTGIHLIKRLENARADVWSTPLIIDPVTGRKFGKSEGNAVWLAPDNTNKTGNFTSVFDYYQFWLSQPDESVEYLLKVYTLLEPEEISEILEKHAKSPEKRLAQRALALGSTSVVHGVENAKAVENLTNILFDRSTDFSSFTADEISEFAKYLPVVPKDAKVIDILLDSGLAPSKKKAREFLKSGAISVSGTKISDENLIIKDPAIIKKGKNAFAVVR